MEEARQQSGFDRVRKPVSFNVCVMSCISLVF